MEFIYDLLDQDEPCLSRRFEFTLDGKSYICQFGEASDRLLILARSFVHVKESSTNYRNLVLFREYANYIAKKRSSSGDVLIDLKPVSFYVSGFLDLEESRPEELSKHLNFFMQYYDRDSPYIIIHPPTAEPLESPKQLQFIETSFPDKISTRLQDPFLLDLAMVASTVHRRLQFVYYYQILEYAAFYYVEDEVRRNLRHVLSTPDIQSNLDRHISRILDIVPAMRQDDDARISKTIENTCQCETIWKELQQNMPYFTKTQEFDGGFVLEPFVSEETTLESFRPMCYSKLPQTLRIIRNALVHGREKRFGRVIHPTPRNDQLLTPWITIARRVAEQVIIFGRKP